jgi:hypothetical protein
VESPGSANICVLIGPDGLDLIYVPFLNQTQKPEYVVICLARTTSTGLPLNLRLREPAGQKYSGLRQVCVCVERDIGEHGCLSTKAILL